MRSDSYAITAASLMILGGLRKRGLISSALLVAGLGLLTGTLLRARQREAQPVPAGGEHQRQPASAARPILTEATNPQPIQARSRVEEASEESFPASDPPSWTPGRV